MDDADSFTNGTQELNPQVRRQRFVNGDNTAGTATPVVRTAA